MSRRALKAWHCQCCGWKPEASKVSHAPEVAEKQVLNHITIHTNEEQS